MALLSKAKLYPNKAKFIIVRFSLDRRSEMKFSAVISKRGRVKRSQE